MTEALRKVCCAGPQGRRPSRQGPFFAGPGGRAPRLLHRVASARGLLGVCGASPVPCPPHARGSLALDRARAFPHMADSPSGPVARWARRAPCFPTRGSGAAVCVLHGPLPRIVGPTARGGPPIRPAPCRGPGGPPATAPSSSVTRESPYPQAVISSPPTDEEDEVVDGGDLEEVGSEVRCAACGDAPRRVSDSCWFRACEPPRSAHASPDDARGGRARPSRRCEHERVR